jgi:hypothetical protein
MSLVKTIKKTLVETKENKKRLIQESKIVKTRFNIILESSKLKSKKDINDVLINVLIEMVYLDKQGFNDKVIAENASSVFNVIGNLLGGSTNSVIEAFREKGVKYILGQLGLGDNSALRNYMTTALENTDLKDVPKLFSDCDFLTKKISEAVPESYLRQLEMEESMGGEFSDIVKKTLHGVIKDSDFSDRLETRIHSVICPLVDKMSSKFGDKLNGMKSSLIAQPKNTQL